MGYVESKDDAKAAALITKTEGVKPLADYKGYKRWGMDEDGFAAIGKNAVLIGTSEAVLQEAIDIREGGGSRAGRRAVVQGHARRSCPRTTSA